MIIKEEDYLKHYGTPRHSGRYPYGSGEDPTQHTRSFLEAVLELKKQGLTESEIARGMGLVTTDKAGNVKGNIAQLRARKSIEKNAQKQADVGQAMRMKERQYSNMEIGRRMGINESSVRALTAPGAKDKADVLQTHANMLQSRVDDLKKQNGFGYVQVGTGVENHMQISKDRLAVVLAVLQEKGYVVKNVQVDQLGTAKGNKTLVKVLAPAGTTYRDIKINSDKIKLINEYSDDGGHSYNAIQPPLVVDSKRIAIRYAEDGGKHADGVIYVRPGVSDVSLGKAKYAQVRIAVDDTHFLKGMAVYKNDLPKGVDLEFNTNKSDTGNKLDAMKDIKSDPENPFGSFVRQLKQDPKNPNKVTSAMNIVNEEGDWDSWSRTLSSQTLSKQSPELAKSQLNMTFENKKEDLAGILKLTNPAVRKKLLDSFADGADASAVHLEAAKLPGASWHVILPMNSLKENQIFAPNYANGDVVALIRYPHGGTFEIPELVVNNKHAKAKELIAQAPDAVAINSKVAERLSGADFDGDAVLVIPNGRQLIKTTPALAALQGFNPKDQYKGYEGMPKMTAQVKQTQMGLISNLITDMTIKKASQDDLARAIKHSMVVIDAENHNLNYKQSAIDNNIKQLKQKYQENKVNGKVKYGGASTLISRAESRQEVRQRKPSRAVDGGPVNLVTGEKRFTPTGKSFVRRTVSKRTGLVNEKVVFNTSTSKKLIETTNAHTLSSGTAIEKVYADHSNKLKDLANQARLASVHTKTIPYSNSAYVVYKDAVKTLNAKLDLVFRNRPLERQAQILANHEVNAKVQANPGMAPEDLKKVKFIALTTARNRVGTIKHEIKLTPYEWEAIQAGAISNHKLEQILNKADLDIVKKLATPRATVTMTTARLSRAMSMLGSGYTQAEVAMQLGVSLSTLKASLATG